MTSSSSRITRSICAFFVVTIVAVGSAQRAGESGEQAPITGTAQLTTAALMADAASDPGEPAWGADLLNGSTFSAITLTETSTVPPDPGLAAGPTQVLVMANGRLRSFDKTTGSADGVLNLHPNTFFSSVRSGGGVFGGRIRFDRWTGRWFITAATDAVPGRVLIASSNSATITASTVWRFSGFDNTFAGSTCGIDAPTLAIDSHALYLGVNQFCGDVYSGTSAFVVRKSSAIDTATLFVTAFHNLTGTPGGSGLYAPRGTDNVETTVATGYLVGVDNAAFGSLVLRRVLNPAGVPTLSTDVPIAIPMTAGVVPVPHQGNTAGANGRLNGGDDRLTSAVLRGGQLWTVHSVGVTESGAAGNTRNGVRWYALGSIDAVPSIVQSGALHSTTGPGSVDERHYWNASLAVTGLGRTIVGFNTAGTNETINAGTADRTTASPAGTLTDPVLFTATTAAYNPALDPGSALGRRWGRYSETVSDGCDDMTGWTVQAYTGASNSWTLQVARVRAAAPPTAASVSPATISSGLASVDLTVTAGSGGSWTNPATGFLCRTAVTIPGVIVNSVTVSSPTTLLVNVSTLNALPGGKTISVVNPDGQASLSGSLLMVEPGVAMGVDAIVPAQPLVVRGWAIDGRAASGTGVDAVAAYAYPATGDPILLGVATLGLSRSDVAATYGARFGKAGFFVRAQSVLPNGTYTVVVFARSTVTGVYDTRSIPVTVTAPTAPFGHVDSPADGAVVAGEVGFTGWALDAAGVREIRVYRQAVGAEPAGQEIYVGTGDFVRGARPDVAAAFPNLPDNDNAGWGFMVLSNMLPDSGNGLFQFSIYAVNHAGLTTRIGTRTITAANNGNPLPFGTIDTPSQGAEVSGTIVNFGWVLTRSPLGIPFDGSTINVYIDGVYAGHPVYNQYRSDIATLFPNLTNSNGAVGYFMIDTRLLADGLHSIAWGVTDAAGNVNGIGSRNFRVKNGS